MSAFKDKITAIRSVFSGLVEHIKEDLPNRIRTREERKKLNHEFLADIGIETLQQPGALSHWILWTAVSFFFIAIIWAKFAILNEVTHGDGVVIPSSQVQVIQNLEGGIVDKILVHEGDVVNKDQILMKLDKKRFAASYQEQVMRQISLELRVDRLEAELDNKEFIVAPEIEQKYASRVEQERLQFETRVNENKRMQQDYDLAAKQMEMLRPLVKSGSASTVELLQQEHSAIELKGNILKARSAALDELNTAKTDLAALKESNSANEDRLDRTIVRSPVHGIIKKIYVNTVGGVIGAGSSIMDVVPLDDTLLIEAKVKPQDIGFIHPQQNSLVKISAYDFSIYGGLTGIVETISADTIKGEKDDSYYVIKVRTHKNYLTKGGKQLNIIPGMHANVDILTGQKSVLDYILKPILKARQNAMTER